MYYLWIPIEIGEEPTVVYGYMDFLIMDNKSAYNDILERPALKNLKAITSIYHLCQKFETLKQIAIIKDNQIETRECYLSALRK